MSSHLNISKHLPFLPILILLAVTSPLIFTGCPGPLAPPEVIEEFSWADFNETTRWRSLSPIEWHGTYDSEAVFAEAESTGKPILCYVSRYESDLTATIEDGLFSEDAWGEVISEKFIAWEVNCWENPDQGQWFLGGANDPAIFVMPAISGDGDEFAILDAWFGTDILSFPLHEGILPLDNPEAEARFTYLADAGPEDAYIPELPMFDLEGEEFVSMRLGDLLDGLDYGEGFYPSDCLYMIIATANDESAQTELRNRITAWGSYMISVDEEAVWIPEDAYIPGFGWRIDPIQTLDAIICAIAADLDWPVNKDAFLNRIGELSAFNTENGGGFPPYFDVRSTFSENQDYLTDESSILETSTRLIDPIPGPQDIVWVNASIMADLVRLVNIDPELSASSFNGDSTFGEAMTGIAIEMIDYILENPTSTESPDIYEQTYLLDLLVQVYQRTADRSYLDKAGEIAGTFSPEEPELWFYPDSLPCLPDLAIALHQYSWLAEDEAAREAANYITEEAIPYAPGFDITIQNRLAFAYDITHSKCLHVTIIGSPDDEAAQDLLAASLTGWDPRKLAQIVDPELDTELFERKGYPAFEETAAWMCVDDICWMPSYDAETLLESVQEGLDELNAAGEDEE